MRSLRMNDRLAGLTAGTLLALGLLAPTLAVGQESAGGSLRPLAEFDAIADETERSVALFEEVGKVIEHPRCLNCHPAGDVPTQGMDMHPHQPPVTRGEANFGVAGMECNTCHQAENVEIIGQAEGLASIPGNPSWHLAPIEMAWVGKSLGAICEQIKDPERNGGMTMDDLIHHMAEDELVGWGWHPGKGREPVPGTQAEFGALFEAWVTTGAHCPS